MLAFVGLRAIPTLRPSPSNLYRPSLFLDLGGENMVTLRPSAADEGSGAHAGTLEIGRRRIALPGRLVTSSELRSAKASKLSEAVETAALVVGKLVWPATVKAATSDEKAWQAFAQTTGAAARMIPGAARVFQATFLNVEFEDAEPLRAFLDLQHLLNFDVVTVPYGANPSAEDVLTAYDFARSWAKKRRLDVPLVPVVPAQESREDADALLAALLKRGAEAIGLDLQGTFPYHTLRAVESLKARHEDLWVHAFQVPPKISLGGRLPTSEGMALPYFGVDTFSRWFRPPPPAPVKKDKINVFDPRGWGVFCWKDQEKEYGARLACGCVVCKGKDLNDFFEPEDKKVLDLSKVHDHLSMDAELTAARKRIGEDGYGAAMEEHKFTRAFLSRVAEATSP
jgi:hypothetical protein